MRDKIVRSHYFFVVNSNTSIKNKTPEGKKRLEDFVIGLKKIFLSENILNFIRINDEKDKNIPKQKLIMDINTEIDLEYGPENGYLHAHIDMIIDHMSNITLVCNRITKYYADKFGLSVFCPPPRFITDNTHAIKKYSRKMQRYTNLYITTQLINIDGEREIFTKKYSRY